jgi:hypothetical protein
MEYPRAINNTPMGMLPDVTCRILPRITQITQKNICENLRNLWQKDDMQVIVKCPNNQQYVIL